MVMGRRSRRARLWNMGILFLIYTCITVYSANSDAEKIPEDDTFNGKDIPDPDQENDEDKKIQGDISYSTDINLNDIFSTITLENITMTSALEPNATTPSPLNKHGRPTWRPIRDNCAPPALEQFPRPLMGPSVRRHGGLILHILVAVFTFFGLAIVCDDYFVASLDRLCEELKLSPDVAGATFMAAGSSAPELATVIIGVFFAKDDIGISGVIGSAVFNIMFVISVCALCSGTVCQLNWWPIVRDCFFYCLSIIIMFIVICNDVISWGEALVMLLFYVVYCIALHFNSSLERWALSLNLPIKLPTKEEQSALVTYKNMPDTSYTQSNNQQVTSLSQDPQQKQPTTATSHYDQTNEYQGYTDTNSSWDPNAAWADPSAPVAPPASVTLGMGVTTTGVQPPTDDWGMSQWNQNEGQQNLAYNYGDQLDQVQNVDTNKSTNPGTVVTGQPIQQEFYKSKDPKGLEPQPNPLDKPTSGGLIKLIYWYIIYPIHYTCRLTMPDCRTEKYRNWYPFTFIVSMVWISFYSYFMVWMITIIGSTLGIPDTVMGLTFVAAGVSVPDALSSIAVIKEGYGDMAVSNAIGSNVFDILVCLGLPWFIQTAIIVPGSHVNVISKGLVYSTLSLLSTVVFLLLSTHLNGWKLDKRLGIILMIWYLLFITFAALYEMNVFGQMSPKACHSEY